MQQRFAQTEYSAAPAAPELEGQAFYPPDTTNGSYVGDGVLAAVPAAWVADDCDHAIQAAPVRQSEKQRVTEPLAVAIVDLQNQLDAFDELSEALDEESDVIHLAAELLEEYRDQLKAG